MKTNAAQTAIPRFVYPFLWSYDISQMHPTNNKRTIIREILSHGDYRSTRWMQQTYSVADIREVFSQTGYTMSPKRRNYWALILDIPQSSIQQSRFNSH